MLSALKCRIELAGFRWRKIKFWDRVSFLSSLVGLVAVGFFVPIPNSIYSFTSWVIVCLFFVFLTLVNIGNFRRQARQVNKLYKAQMNIIRRKYGVKEQ